MATTASVDKENTPIVGRSESQMLEDEVTRLEAENAEMEEKLQLDKRVSFGAAAEPVLDPTTPSRSTEKEASTPTTIEVSTPTAEVAEQQTQPTDVFWMTPILELFAKLTGGGFCVPSNETLAKEEASTIAASPAIAA